MADPDVAAVAKGFDALMPEVRARFIEGSVSAAVQKTNAIGEPDPGTRTNQVTGDDYATAFTTLGALDPVYDPEMLALLFEHSNSLRQNVDGMAVNVDGFGHRFDPLFNLEAKDIDQRIADAILTDRQRALDELEDGTEAAPPTDAEIKKEKDKITRLMRIERIKLTHFFEFCSPDTSFVTLRRRTRQDIEVTGNGYWEVLRNRAGQIVQFVYMPSFTIRLLPLDVESLLIKSRVRVSELSFDEVEYTTRMRRYVQVVEARAVFFKELGDPRLISSGSGAIYPDMQTMHRNEPGIRAANELIHFRIHSPRSPYGVPRWIGNLLAVIGSRQAEEVNFNYFENKSVPPLAILVSGGRMSQSSVERVTSYIDTNIKGKRNFHKILVLEAESAGGADVRDANGARLKIDIKPLTGAQHSDALFQNYDERNIDKVGQSFRLPRMLRGDIRDFNRSCYSADTETLTEHGWKRHAEIGWGEKIAAFNPKKGEIVFVEPAYKHVAHVENETMIRFHGRATDCLVTGDHKMLVRSSDRRPDRDPQWISCEAESVPFQRFDVMIAAAEWNGEERTAAFHLPKTCKIERGHDHVHGVAFDDWLEFLGYFISEGGLVMTDNSLATYLVYLDQKKPHVREKIRACLDRLGWTYSVQEKPCGTTHFLFSNRCLRDWIVQNVGTHSADWHLPTEYLGLCTRQLRILFDAMMAGDGTVDSRDDRDSGAYYSSSSVLLDQVQRIAIQLGMSASIGPGDGTSTGRVCLAADRRWTTLRAGANPNGYTNVERIEYTGEVYCFSVPGYGFFVTRRNGKVAIQGNTADAALVFAEMQVFEPERQEFDFIINRKILAMLGVRFWKFTSLAPIMRDPAAMSEIIRNLMNASVLTPEEARGLAGDVFNREFPVIKAPWTQQPPALTIAGIVPPNADGTPGAPPESTFGPAGGALEPDKPEAAGIEARMRARLHKAARREAEKLLAIRKALKLVEHDAWFEQFAARDNAAE